MKMGGYFGIRKEGSFQLDIPEAGEKYKGKRIGYPLDI